MYFRVLFRPQACDRNEHIANVAEQQYKLVAFFLYYIYLRIIRCYKKNFRFYFYVLRVLQVFLKIAVTPTLN